jgi:hypothetical protein
MAPNYVVRFDNPGFTMIPLAEGLGDVKGLVGSPDGLLYVGHHTELCQAGSSISVFDPIIEFEVNSLTVDAGIATGVSSVQLDSDGRAWALNICTDDLVGFNPGTGQKAGKIQVGNDPFAYSNLAATVLGPAQPDSGYYRHVFGALDADEAWSTMSLALAGGGFVKVRVRTAATIPQLNGAAWSAPVGPFPPEKFPLDLSALGLPGSFLEVEVTLYSDGGTAPILKSISATCETMP